MASQHHTLNLIEKVLGFHWLKCFDCGREMLLHFPPDYHKFVLVKGDEIAIHDYGTGGLTMGNAQIRQQP